MGPFKEVVCGNNQPSAALSHEARGHQWVSLAARVDPVNVARLWLCPACAKEIPQAGGASQRVHTLTVGTSWWDEGDQCVGREKGLQTREQREESGSESPSLSVIHMVRRKRRSPVRCGDQERCITAVATRSVLCCV
eukprot:GGOE01053918.1.p1 GENE.GGOE01053918.1~~GGOE01053918.1.p1  ORF type:complete len:137 (+),score=3.06 GGOE01053918.1:67-477(+)